MKKKRILTAKERIKCHGIIHSFSTGSGAVGAGLAQIPVSDSFIITPMQIMMIVALGDVFGVKLSKSAAAAMAASTASLFGKSASKVIAHIPVIGNVANGVTAVSITELLGWKVVEEFSQQMA